MDWKNVNVLVTGATGFIGGWLAKTLVDKGANVTVLERDRRAHNSLDTHNIRGKVNIVSGDLADLQTMLHAIVDFEIEYVYHLAAQAIVGKANRNPLPTFESNIKGTWTLLEACRIAGNIKGVIVASSDKAYGCHEELPYSEDQPLHGLYPYDASKVCTDVLTRSYHVSYGLPTVVTRNGNTYGGGDMNFNRIIPDGCVSLLTGKELIIRSDGTPERDYIHVEDVVDCYLTLGENIDRKEVQGQAFNFGCESPISVLDLFKLLVKVSGKDTKVTVAGTATNEIDRQYLSNAKVRKVLNWNPTLTLEQGLKKTLDWYEEFLKKEGKL